MEAVFLYFLLGSWLAGILVVLVLNLLRVN